MILQTSLVKVFMLPALHVIDDILNLVEILSDAKYLLNEKKCIFNLVVPTFI